MNFFEILYAQKNGAALPANFFDLLFAKSFTPAIEWGEYDGTLPATYSANGSTLADYRVYGANGGAGDRTVNLWNNDDFWDNGHQFTNNAILFGYAYTVSPGTYTISTNVINNVNTSIASVFAVAASPNQDPAITSGSNGVFVNRPQTVTVSENQALWIIIRVANGSSQSYLIWNRETFSHYWIMLILGSTAPAEYVPYGYGLDMAIYKQDESGIPLEQGGWSYNAGLKQIFKKGSIDTDYYPYRLGTTQLFQADKNKSYTSIIMPPTLEVSVDGILDNQGRVVASGWGSNIRTVVGATQYACSIRKPNPVNPSAKGQAVSLSDVDFFAIVEGDTYLDTTSIYIGDTPLGEDEYVDYKEQKVYRRTENLFDKNATDTSKGYVDNAYLYYTGLVNSETTSYNISEYIEVEPNTAYTLSGVTGNAPSICQYDENKIYLTGTKYQYNATITFTTGSTTRYIRISIPKSTVDTIMLIKDTVAPSTYISYLQPQDPPVPLPALPTVDGTNIVDYAGQSAAPSRFYAKYQRK